MVDMGRGLSNVLCRMLQRQDSEANITTEHCPRSTNKVYKISKSKWQGWGVDQDGITTGESIIMKNKFEYKFSDQSVIKLCFSHTQIFFSFIHELYKSVKRNKWHF